MPSRLISLTFDSYEVASERTAPIDLVDDNIATSTAPLNTLTFTSIAKLLRTIFLLIIHCFYPFLLIVLLIVAIHYHTLVGYTCFVFLSLHLLSVVDDKSCRTTAQPGLNFVPNDKNKAIVSGSQLLSSEYNDPGSVTSSRRFGFTPWILTGDLCTLLPYIANSPRKQKYSRRWIRVPLAAGPLNRLQHRDAHGEHEAVAIDYVLAGNSNLDGKSNKALLILAGLSGGSNEGYCLDLVDFASQRGWHCFVMLGRGLAEGKPCLSDALFHGARTSDVATTAGVIKEAFGCPVMLAGISLGGIIVANSLARDVFGDAIDGGVSISGSCEIAKNIEYQHSLNVWQPILAQGLKRIFVDDPIPLRKLKRAIGGDADSRIQNIMTVFDFDTVVVTALNGFDDVMHYYDDISATPAMLEKGLHKPLLLLHALDDPITHVDTVSPAKTKPSPFLFTLLTSVGGHVGWPLGWFPWRRRWEFQNRVAIEFLESVLSSNCKYTNKYN